MYQKINEKLNEVFNKLANCDCPMWCEKMTPDYKTVYLNWHKYQDDEISAELFKSCALLIIAEFKEVEFVQCPWWGISRKSIYDSIEEGRKRSLHLKSKGAC